MHHFLLNWVICFGGYLFVHTPIFFWKILEFLGFSNCSSFGRQLCQNCGWAGSEPYVRSHITEPPCFLYSSLSVFFSMENLCLDSLFGSSDNHFDIFTRSQCRFVFISAKLRTLNWFHLFVLKVLKNPKVLGEFLPILPFPNKRVLICHCFLSQTPLLLLLTFLYFFCKS